MSKQEAEQHYPDDQRKRTRCGNRSGLFDDQPRRNGNEDDHSDEQMDAKGKPEVDGFKLFDAEIRNGRERGGNRNRSETRP